MMGANGWRGRLRIKALSPIHVGTGERLAPPGFEYGLRGGKIVRYDIERFIEDRNVPFRDKENLFIGKLPRDTVKSLRNRMRARYSLIPASGGHLGKEVREAIKMPGDVPYLPGSSVKGSIRTALTWNLFYHLTEEQKEVALNAAGRENRNQFKAQILENLAFRGGTGGDAKADAMKALFVADSGNLGTLELRLYDLYTARSGRAERDNRGPFALEAIPPGSSFDIDLKIDSHFLSRSGNYSPSENPGIVMRKPESFYVGLKSFGRFVGNVEQEFYSSMGLKKVARFFEQDDLLPIGFGTGWNAKTIGTFLEPAQIRQAKIQFFRGAPPPKSRRVALDGNGNAVFPLGWARFELVVR